MMKTIDVLIAIVRCEFKAGYDAMGGWKVSAKGLLPVLLLTIMAVKFWGH